MSCTVFAVPILLYQAFIGLTAAAGIAAAAANAANNATLTKQDYETQENCQTKNIDNICTDIHEITVNNIIEKEFETPFMDKEILLKTMEEHGITNIKESFDGKITGNLDTFSFLFEKPSENFPYRMKITCNQNDNAKEKAEDINSEYALNVQEAAYLSIIEKLKDQNMQIEDETVQEDNTIVLTINLE